ncbi:MAG: hypothetical protein ACF8PG_13445 [Maioricimonas sp. JB045]
MPGRVLTIAVLAGVLTSGSIAFAQKKSPLNEHYVLGRIRVFYTNEGAGAVPSTDADRNGVPDRVEDVAKQIRAAHLLFCGVLKFPDPFESERYKGVTCIQVSLRDRKEMGGGNGVAFESAQRARRIPEGQPGDRAIVMSIASQVDPKRNITPAHELFHLIQYSTTYFKNGWYLEGMARWAEHALAEGGLGDVKYSIDGPWPQKPQQLQQLAKMKYDAEFLLWNPVAGRTDRDGLLTDEMLGEELCSLCYSDGSPVLRDRFLQGAEVMRDVLIELGKQDDIAFKALGYDEWSEENQRAEENNPFIYKGVMDALRRHAPPVGRYRVPRIRR